MAGKFKAYVSVSIGPLKGVAMLDSGNNWRTAISPQYAHKLGIDLIKDVNPIKNMPVSGTAKKGTAMKVLGETKKFMHMKLSS